MFLETECTGMFGVLVLITSLVLFGNVFQRVLLLLGFSACGGSEDTVGLFLETFSDPVKAASHPGRIVMLFYFAKKQTV